MNQLRDVSTICRRSWYIAAHIILDLQNFFHWYIIQRWKLKRPHIQLRPHHFWIYTSNLTTVVKSVLKFMTSILKIINFPNMCSNIPAAPAYGLEEGHNSYPLVCWRPVDVILMWLNEHYSCFKYRDREYLLYVNCYFIWEICS
jgi:hypothetical protein